MSVETISTKESGSENSSPRAPHQIRSTFPIAKLERKRKKTSRSDDSFTSVDESARRRERRRASSRSTRRKIGDSSPHERGRRRSRTHSQERRSTYSSDEDRGRIKHNSNPIPTTTTYDSDSDRPAKLNSGHPQIEGIRRNPSVPGRPRRNSNYRDNSGSHSRGSYQRVLNTAYQQDKTAYSDIRSARHGQESSERETSPRHQRGPKGSAQHNNTVRNNERYAMNTPQRRTSGRAVQREKSLSPFSKRLALTQAMNMGQ
jgi:hypothetical protein